MLSAPVVLGESSSIRRPLSVSKGFESGVLKELVFFAFANEM